MDREFEEIYNYLYQRWLDFPEGQPNLRFYAEPWIYLNGLNAVVESIRNGIAISELEEYVRSDARYLLLLNFVQMVAVPIGLSNERQLLDRLLNDITQDTHDIIRTADAISRVKKVDNEARRITGGDVIKAIAGIYDDLRINGRRIWSRNYDRER